MKRLLALVLPLTMVLLFSGTMGCCTTVGYIIGKGIDNSNATRDTLRLLEPSDWRSGRETIVISKDSTVYNGEFEGMGEIPLAEYQFAYNEWRAHQAEGSFSPRLGDTMEIGFTSPAHDHIMCRLVGFQETSILVDRRGGVHRSDDAGHIRFEDIATISGKQGAEVSGVTLLNLVRTGEVPSTKCLIVSVEDNASQIPWHNVSQVQQIDIRTAKTGKILGAVIGLVCDAAITTVIINRIIQSLDEFSGGPMNIWK